MPELHVPIKLTRPGVMMPEYKTEGSAGFDIAIAEDLYPKPGIIHRCPTGLIVGTPSDHMLYITFRSSTPARYGVTVLEGIVDSDYSGDDDELLIQVMTVFNLPKPRIPAGTAIAQGIFLPVSRARFNLHYGKMGESRGGFGSTG